MTGPRLEWLSMVLPKSPQGVPGVAQHGPSQGLHTVCLEWLSMVLPKSPQGVPGVAQHGPSQGLHTFCLEWLSMVLPKSPQGVPGVAQHGPPKVSTGGARSGSAWSSPSLHTGCLEWLSMVLPKSPHGVPGVAQHGPPKVSTGGAEILKGNQCRTHPWLPFISLCFLQCNNYDCLLCWPFLSFTFTRRFAGHGSLLSSSPKR